MCLCTERMEWMSHWKRKETKLQAGTAGPGSILAKKIYRGWGFNLGLKCVPRLLRGALHFSLWSVPSRVRWRDSSVASGGNAEMQKSNFPLAPFLVPPSFARSSSSSHKKERDWWSELTSFFARPNFVPSLGFVRPQRQATRVGLLWQINHIRLCIFYFIARLLEGVIHRFLLVATTLQLQKRFLCLFCQYLYSLLPWSFYVWRIHSSDRSHQNLY